MQNVKICKNIKNNVKESKRYNTKKVIQKEPHIEFYNCL